MTIVDLQRHVGAEPDGMWGMKSAAACQAHLHSLMPQDNPWPKSDPDALTRFFGQPGNEANLVNLNVKGLGLCYDGAKLRTIRCHEKVGDSLHRVLTAISQGPDADILKEYAGCYNYRVMRGGTSLSCHAWGIAIDLAPDTNGNRTPWPKIATMPITVMEAMAREGMLSGGAVWGRDAMHFQATQ
jgi:hypothetical protein